jgi:hypothetical protein
MWHRARKDDANWNAAFRMFARSGSESGFYFGLACGIDSAVTTETPERRRQPRINLSQMVHIRPFDQSLPSEYCTTVNVSQDGLYLAASAGHYAPGMNLYITSDYQPGSPLNHSLTGLVVRAEKRADDKWGVAIQTFSPSSSSIR